MKWDEKIYRKRIRQKKEQLPCKQMFLSGRYQGLLKKMAREITDGSFSNVLVSCLGKTFPVGMFDGTQIVINLDHGLIQGYTKKDLMNLGIIGVLGHECGHKNYSEIGLRHKYLLGIRDEHKFYPHAPLPLTKADEDSLTSLKECFDNGDEVVISYVYEVAAFLQNLLEDRYIEYKMCRNYPGSIRNGILMNQVREFDSFPSVRTMQDTGQPKTYIMLNLVSQYLFQKTVNAWDGIDECYMECLNACKGLLGENVLQDGKSVRYLLTSQILLKLWGFIRSDTDAIREKMEEDKKQQDDDPQKTEPQENAMPQTGNPPDGSQPDFAETVPKSIDRKERAEEIAKKLRQCLPSYSKEPGEIPDGAYPDLSDVKADDMDWSGSWEEDDKTDAVCEYAADLNEAETLGMQSSDNADENKKSALQESSEPEKYDENIEKMKEELSSKAVGRIPQSDAELLKFPSEAAKEQVDQEEEERLHQKLGELLRQTDFGSSHENVPIQILRKREVSDDAIRRYSDLQKEIRKVRKKLETDLLPYLEKKSDRMEKGLPIGRKMDLHALYRPDGKVFVRKQLPGVNNDTVLALLIDLSGSMSLGGRIEKACFAALCLYEFCREADIPVAVYGHHTGLVQCNGKKTDSKEAVCLRSLAEFDSIDGNDAFRILDASPTGSNRDGAAIRFMGEMLLERPEKKKILALISDGLPNAENYSGEPARIDLMAAKEELTRKGITFLTAAIADDREAIRRIYGDAYLDISDVRKLPQKLMKQIIRQL